MRKPLNLLQAVMLTSYSSGRASPRSGPTSNLAAAFEKFVALSKCPNNTSEPCAPACSATPACQMLANYFIFYFFIFFILFFIFYFLSFYSIFYFLFLFFCHLPNISLTSPWQLPDGSLAHPALPDEGCAPSDRWPIPSCLHKLTVQIGFKRCCVSQHWKAVRTQHRLKPIWTVSLCRQGGMGQRWTSKGPPAATTVNNSRIVVQRSEPTSLRTAPLRKGHFRY